MGIGLLHGFDHGETLPFGPAKIPTAFFKMSRWLVTLWSWARSRRTSPCNSWLVGAIAGSLPSAAGDAAASVAPNCRRHARRLSVVMPSPLGHPSGRHAAGPLRHRRPFERFIVGPVRCARLRLNFFAHGVDLPSPRAAVYFIRAISNRPGRMARRGICPPRVTGWRGWGANSPGPNSWPRHTPAGG